MSDREKKLPKWAQALIHELREKAECAQEYADRLEGEQSESATFFDYCYDSGARKHRKVGVHNGHRLEFEACGIKGEIIVRDGRMHSDNTRISIYFDAKEYGREVYIRPQASNTFDLVVRGRKS